VLLGKQKGNFAEQEDVMSIDDNDYIEAALVVITEQIEDANRLTQQIWEAYGRSENIEADLDKLEKLVRTACDSLEIFNNYNGQYDRICKWCWGEHPGCYEVQCRLCDVQRLCVEETRKREAIEQE
jgi:hypothetical protein